MANIFFGLNIGRSALLTHQVALDVTGHNLANVQTEGYSRQRVAMAPGLPVQTPQGAVGSGVNMERIQRLQLGYLERQIAQVRTQHQSDSTLVNGLGELQTLLGEPSSEGLGAAMTEFWNSWEALSARPADASLRAQVLDRAEHLATVYNQKIRGFQEAEARFQDTLADDLAEVNALAKQVASLNASIAKSEAGGYTANDLRDQREVVIGKIADKMGVEAEVDGSYLNLRVPGGPYIVHRVESYEIQATEDSSTGWIQGFHLESALVTPSGGEMGALLELRDRLSPGLRSELSSLMATVADRVNGLHASGFDRDGQPGLNLFVWEGGAESVAVASSAGVSAVAAGSGLAPGTHHLSVSVASDPANALVANGLGNLTRGSIALTAAGTYRGAQAINLDYHVRVLSANGDPSSPDGLRVQLFRGDQAVGAAQTVSGGGPVVWSDIDGMTFTAAVAVGPGAIFVPGERSNGLSTVGTVSLDGGPGVAVNLTGIMAYTLQGGSGQGYLPGGSAALTFDGRSFSGGTFTVYGAAARLGVNAWVAADADRLAAAAPAADGSAGAAGDGEMARRIADLAVRSIFEDIGETPAGYLGRTVQSLGAKGRDAQIFEKASGSILLQLNAQRESEVGVNVDEEMVQLLQYQRGFEAAARFLTTVDGLIDTLINRVGLAGR